MGLKVTLRKGLAIAKKIAEQFEEPRDTYTPTSKSAQVRQRIETRLAALTPAIAPEMLFVAASGWLAQGIAFEGYFRKFRVEVASFGAAMVGRGANQSPFEIAVTIEIGYPEATTVTVEGAVYEVADLVSHDDEQLDQLMRSGDLFTNPTSIAAAAVVGLESAFALGNTVRRHRYTLRVTRVW